VYREQLKIRRNLHIPVLRIHDNLGWIRIRRSMPLDPDPYPDPAIFVIDLQDASKKVPNFSTQFFLLFTF
jgi:hypothetical protein